MSSLTMPIIACITRSDLSAVSNRGSARGMICHDRPNGSVNQPQRLSTPPPDSSAAHSRSTSACVSTVTLIEAAGYSLQCGPPFSPQYFCPIKVKATMNAPAAGSRPL